MQDQKNERTKSDNSIVVCEKVRREKKKQPYYRAREEGVGGGEGEEGERGEVWKVAKESEMSCARLLQRSESWSEKVGH